MKDNDGDSNTPTIAASGADTAALPPVHPWEGDFDAKAVLLATPLHRWAKIPVGTEPDEARFARFLKRKGWHPIPVWMAKRVEALFGLEIEFHDDGRVRGNGRHRRLLYDKSLAEYVTNLERFWAQDLRNRRKLRKLRAKRLSLRFEIRTTNGGKLEELRHQSSALLGKIRKLRLERLFNCGVTYVLGNLLEERYAEIVDPAAAQMGRMVPPRHPADVG